MGSRFSVKRLMVTTFAVSALAAGPAAVIASAAPAGADTTACAAAVTTHNGVTANWCASQENVSHGLMLAAPNKAVAYAQLTAKPASSTNASEDFQVFPPTATAAPVKVFEFSPRGVGSGLCAALNNKHTKLVLKNCNQTSLGQQFQPGGTGADGGNTWDSLLTGQAITIPGGAAFARLTLTPDSTLSTQTFTYKQ
jgi:hypothetical protein